MTTEWKRVAFGIPSSGNKWQENYIYICDVKKIHQQHQFIATNCGYRKNYFLIVISSEVNADLLSKKRSKLPVYLNIKRNLIPTDDKQEKEDVKVGQDPAAKPNCN